MPDYSWLNIPGIVPPRKEDSNIPDFSQTDYTKLDDPELVQTVETDLCDPLLRQQADYLLNSPNSNKDQNSNKEVEEATRLIDRNPGLVFVLGSLGSKDPFLDMVGLIKRGITPSDISRLVKILL